MGNRERGKEGKGRSNNEEINIKGKSVKIKINK